ncbi:hypothetical protein ACFU76_06555 [Streptomyces sp. NPDC057539]|uniref:hypothetical protein n=1 Tax=Streptomyces sp. NPDC057539 TaxID=3346159 RepID=UPI0036C4BCE0
MSWHTANSELSRLGRTLEQRAADVLAYCYRPGTSNGPTTRHARSAGSATVTTPSAGIDKVNVADTADNNRRPLD